MNILAHSTIVSGLALVVYKTSGNLRFNWPMDLSTKVCVNLGDLLKSLFCAVAGLRHGVIRY